MIVLLFYFSKDLDLEPILFLEAEREVEAPAWCLLA
jgi:hypothetical protein